MASTVKLKLPETVGVPARVPSAARVMPAGSAPPLIAKVYGLVPPLALIDWL